MVRALQFEPFAGGFGGALSPHWATILGVLDGLLAMLREAHVPPFLIKKLYQQLFSFINVQLFNQLLLRRECCSFSNGEYVKTGLAEVEQWLEAAGEAWVGQSWDELRFIRQACAPHCCATLTAQAQSAPACLCSECGTAQACGG